MPVPNPKTEILCYKKNLMASHRNYPPATPIHGVQLWGYLDGLIELESGGYAILDLKSTQNTKWVVKNYALQLVREFGDLRSPTIGLVRLLSCLFAIERICENDGKNRWRRDEHCF